jgi:hypothetical protein
VRTGSPHPSQVSRFPKPPHIFFGPMAHEGAGVEPVADALSDGDLLVGHREFSPVRNGTSPLTGGPDACGYVNPKGRGGGDQSVIRVAVLRN